MAYTNVWNDAVPTGSEAANTIDDIFRSGKVDIEQRFIDIFAMPNFTADPLRPYGLKFTDAQDSIVSLGDAGSGHTRKLIFKDKTNTTTYASFSDTQVLFTPPVVVGIDPGGTTLLRVSDGTASPFAEALGFNLAITSISTSGSITAALQRLTQSVASSGFVVSIVAETQAIHTTGTITTVVGLLGTTDITGVGGTTTWSRGVEGSGACHTGTTVTNHASIYSGAPGTGGTLVNVYGLYIEAISQGSALNYAIKSLGGRIGFVSLPTSAAGLASGDLWNNSGVVNIV